MDTHDKLGQRLGLILTKLNSGERLHIDKLAAEFNVSTRTVQRDLNQRLAYLPIEHEGKRYWLTTASLGKRSNQDLRNFARILGIEGMFPYMDDRVLGTLLDGNEQAPYIVKGISCEDCSRFIGEFRLLEKAVRGKVTVSFGYQDKRYENVQPYRLVNFKGLWYLAAVNESRLKSFVLSKICQLEISYRAFAPDSTVHDEIDACDTIWYGSDIIEVVLKVSPHVADYFKRRTLFPDQRILHELEDGELLVASRIHHPTQVVPLIKYWAPHIEVISPISIKRAVLSDLTKMLDQMTQPQDV